MKGCNIKGGRILFYGGYRYRKDKENIHSVSWRCSQEGWKGRLLVSENSSELTSTTAHSHGSDSAKREVGRIIQTSIGGTFEEAAVLLPTYDSRSSGNFTCREEVVIEEHHRISERGENFLLLDTDLGDNRRILVFGTRTNLDTLKEFRQWAIDDGKAIPVIFGLLPNKQEQTYMKFFESILEVEPNLGPVTVFVDFEIASLSAVRRCFGQARTVGGFFIYAKIYGEKFSKPI
ncbi:hypothetical protein Zmor_014305 [Zophobas morio]|uniref:FLYWCH-type domain-containing protein n=1 Tax=Zophobas morio TaxID=2755281 RepID=A0AA38IBX8_9CUCU|nr:hypothetical protein Zmor_014305 [Zophobas morio]